MCKSLGAQYSRIYLLTKTQTRQFLPWTNIDEVILLHIFRHQEGLEARPKLYTKTVNIPKSLC